MATKKKRICVSISDVSFDKLDELVERYSITKSKVVNTAISLLYHLRDRVEVEYNNDW